MKIIFSIRRYGMFFFIILFNELSAQTDPDSLHTNPVEEEKAMDFDWFEKMQETGFLYGDEEDTYILEKLENDFLELEERKENPLNLNTATRSQLECFPFLSDFQIEKLLQYVYVHGWMESIYELQLVEGMDRETIQYFLPYVEVQSPEKQNPLPSFRNVCQYGRQELTTRFDFPLYTREGYRKQDAEVILENPNKQYLGSSWYHSLRYSFHYGDRIYAGVTAEKDAGEPFFEQHNRKGYDSYSVYFLGRDLGKFRSLAVGKYRVTFGQGLVVGNESLVGKSASVSTMRNRSTGFKKHSSTDEYAYFRGMGATYAWSETIHSSFFYSHRSLDGIADSAVLTSINTTGKHTLSREVERKNAAVLQTLGGNVNYLGGTFQLGVTGVCYFFDKYYDPQYRPYNHYYFRGKRGYNVGVDYRYRFRRSLFSGEIATDHAGNAALIHSLHYFLSSNYQLVALYRSYDKEYMALHAGSISEGGQIQNENGIYLGAETRPLRKCKVAAYVDFFRFPYLKYLVDEPSSGFDGLMQVTYTPFPSLLITGSYRYKQKGKNYTDSEAEEKSVIPYITQCVKFQGNYLLHPDCIWKTSFQWRSAGSEGASSAQGLSVAQTVTYKKKNLPFQFDGTYVWFRTDDYASRVYAYEKGMLYSFYVPSYYGKGNRVSLSVRYDFSSKLMVLFKYGQTVYSDREKIGSGLDAIEGNRKSDLNLQIRWKF